MTRERKRKDIEKPELRELWDKRISADERAIIQNSLRNQVSDTPKVSEMKAMDFAMQHCYERASIVTDNDGLMFRQGDAALLLELDGGPAFLGHARTIHAESIDASILSLTRLQM